MYVLGIESSCDDSSIALFDTVNNKLIDCISQSSEQIQQIYGGVVPEIAAREHEKILLNLVIEIMEKHSIQWDSISHIAYTNTPGLANCLFVGILLAKTLSYIFNIPSIAINHVHAHIFSPGITNKMIFPHIALVVSGKTTALYFVENENNIQLLNETKDNAIGEAYDKVARFMKLPYPGGKHIDDLYKKDLVAMPLLKNKLSSKSPFSFSGIITQTYKLWKSVVGNPKILEKEAYVATIFQDFVINSLIDKINYWLSQKFVKFVTISGGVAANQYFRSNSFKIKAKTVFVDFKFAPDNAAMIAYYASLLIKNKYQEFHKNESK